MALSSKSQDGSGDTLSSTTTTTTKDSFTILNPLPQPTSPSQEQILFSFPLQDNTKTIYVRSLGPEVDPSYIRNLFRPSGFIKGLRVIWERDVDTIAFIEFENQRSAEKAMSEIEKITGNKLDYSYGNGNAATTTKTDSEGEDVNDHDHDRNGNGRVKTNFKIVEEEKGKGFTIFIGNAVDLTDQDLFEAFRHFGTTTRVSVTRNKETGRSLNYAFVTYTDESAAADAIREMDGVTVKNTTIRVEWGGERGIKEKELKLELERQLQREYDKISNEASPDNTTIFVGYKQGILTEHVLRKKFSPYGKITGLICYKEKGYGFIRFRERSSAIQAIHERNGVKTKSGGVVKVGWGKRVYIGPNPELM